MTWFRGNSRYKMATIWKNHYEMAAKLKWPLQNGGRFVKAITELMIYLKKPLQMASDLKKLLQDGVQICMKKPLQDGGQFEKANTK